MSCHGFTINYLIQSLLYSHLPRHPSHHHQQQQSYPLKYNLKFFWKVPQKKITLWIKERMIHLHKNWSRIEIESNFAKTCFYRQKSDFFSFLLLSHFFLFLGKKWCSILLYFVCIAGWLATVEIKFGNIVLITWWLASYMIQGLFLELIPILRIKNENPKKKLGITAISVLFYFRLMYDEWLFNECSDSINSLHKYTV